MASHNLLLIRVPVTSQSNSKHCKPLSAPWAGLLNSTCNKAGGQESKRNSTFAKFTRTCEAMQMHVPLSIPDWPFLLVQPVNELLCLHVPCNQKSKKGERSALLDPLPWKVSSHQRYLEYFPCVVTFLVSRVVSGFDLLRHLRNSSNSSLARYTYFIFI